jgi:hypothetical protein
MLKRFALTIAAVAVLAVPSTGAFAAPQPKADGVLPEEACTPVYPNQVQSLFCGRNHGGMPQ